MIGQRHYMNSYSHRNLIYIIYIDLILYSRYHSNYIPSSHGFLALHKIVCANVVHSTNDMRLAITTSLLSEMLTSIMIPHDARLNQHGCSQDPCSRQNP